MIEPMSPKYEWGQRVRTLLDLENDGSYPDQPEEAILVPAGETGEIVRVGHHVDANISVYIVEFSNKFVVGCLEDELELEIQENR